MQLTQKDFIKRCSRYVDSIDNIFRKNLENINTEYRLKGTDYLIGEVNNDYRHVNLLSEIFKDRKNIFTKEIEDIEKLKRKVIKETCFKKFVIHEDKFKEFFRQETERKPLSSILKDYRERFDFLGLLSVMPFNLFESSYDFIHALYKRIKTTDYFSAQYETYREKLGENMEKEAPKLSFYLNLDVAKAGGKLASSNLFSGATDYRDLISQSQFNPDIVIPLCRRNKVYLWKVMWKIPFNAINLR